MEHDESIEVKENEFETYLELLKKMLERMQADGSLDRLLMARAHQNRPSRLRI